MNARVEVQSDDIVVIGSGIAGLVCALSLAPRRVTLLTKTPGLAGGSSYLAKGGIAAALGADDSPQQHAEDTLAAGAGLSDPDRALGLARDGAQYLRMLIDEGVPFDRALDGSIELAREAAHRHARVVHAGGDATGQVLVSSLVQRIADTPSVQVVPGTFAVDLVLRRGKVAGVLAHSKGRGWVFHRSAQVILATGGIGMTWWHTTNPKEATGDGLAIAARAGAALADLEFMQFHPTALAVESQGGASLPLLTEALRGAGALLLDEQGERFMLRESPDAELATRDVVARAIHARTSQGQGVWLDLRPVLEKGQGSLFPQALAAAADAGFDPAVEPLPVIPAAHYHMGGVQVDDTGRTSVAGLWACGEVATTGVHGANRLASNSLLEGLVYAKQVADDVARCDTGAPVSGVEPPLPELRSLSPAAMEALHGELRRCMSRHVGITRSRQGLEAASAQLAAIEIELGRARTSAAGRASGAAIVSYVELRNALAVARLVTLAALGRRESRGAHFRRDFPRSRAEWQRRQELTLANLS